MQPHVYTFHLERVGASFAGRSRQNAADALERRRQVVKLVRAGFSYTEIARMLELRGQRASVWRIVQRARAEGML